MLIFGTYKILGGSDLLAISQSNLSGDTFCIEAPQIF